MSDATAEQPEVRDTIVIAEDSAPNRKILEHLLQKLGFEVIACENGEQALTKIKSGEYPRLVAVISDLMMPAMDGMELLRQIRGEPTTAKLPVVLVTAMSEKGYIIQARELNVNGYILKPVTFKGVTAKLQELFPQKTFPKLAA